METVDCKRWFVRERNSQDNDPENMVKVENSQGKYLRIRAKNKQVRGVKPARRMICLAFNCLAWSTENMYKDTYDIFFGDRKQVVDRGDGRHVQHKDGGLQQTHQ